MPAPLIFVVDDEEGIRESLTDILSDEGYEVLTAGSGEEALKILRDQNPDLILLDVWLTGMDGLETLQQIKGMKPDIPVIMISGHGILNLP